MKQKPNLRPSARTAVLLAVLAGIGVYVVVDARADKTERASEPAKASSSAPAA